VLIACTYNAHGSQVTVAQPLSPLVVWAIRRSTQVVQGGPVSCPSRRAFLHALHLRETRALRVMRLALIALSASYGVDALLAASTSAKASPHSCEAARRSATAGMAAVSGRTTLAARHWPRATVICRDGFFDSVTEQCNACAMHVQCMCTAIVCIVYLCMAVLLDSMAEPGTPALPQR
jgi:hypothetical protein